MIEIIGVCAILIVVGYILLYNRLQRLRIKVDEGLSGIDVALEKRFDLLSEQIEAVKKYLSHEYKLFTDITTLRTGAEQEEQKRLEQKELTTEAVEAIDKEIARYSHDMEKIKSELQKTSRHRQRNNPGTQKRNAEKRAQKEGKLAETTWQRTGNIDKKINVLTGAHRDLSNVGAAIDALSEQYPIMNSWVSMDKFQLSITNSEEHLQAARRLYNSNVSSYNQAIMSIPWSMVAAICRMEQAEFYEIDEQKRSFSVNFD